MTAYTPQATGSGPKAAVQRFGSHLAGMVMPNIGAFIAWGLITALFIETGWTPVAQIGGFDGHEGLVGPMIRFLLPLLIGYTGGKMVHGVRGGVVGAIATTGVIVGAGDTPMFLGAMIIAPLTAWLMKKVDEAVSGKVKTGFEMLIDNFSAGILGGAMAVGGLYTVGPVIRSLMDAAATVVEFLVDNTLLPLASVFVEPAKVLFLNNAINHGVFTPLGAAQSEADGKSILFMIETNPGPGLGILLAFMLFGPLAVRASTPAAIVIHFFGGIHEIYFPYVLMKPWIILAAIAGGATGVLTNVVLGNGLVASPAPGSIFAYMAMTPRGDHLLVLLSILLATVVSFVVAAAMLGFGRGTKQEEQTSPDPETQSVPTQA